MFIPNSEPNQKTSTSVRKLTTDIYNISPQISIISEIPKTRVNILTFLLRNLFGKSRIFHGKFIRCHESKVKN